MPEIFLQLTSSVKKKSHMTTSTKRSLNHLLSISLLSKPNNLPAMLFVLCICPLEFKRKAEFGSELRMSRLYGIDSPN